MTERWKRIRSSLHPRRLVLGSALFAVGYLLLALLTGDRLPPIVVVGHFRPMLLLAAGALSLLALAQRAWGSAALLVLAGAIGLHLHWLELFPALSSAPHGADLSVTTWNVGAGRASGQEIVAELGAHPAQLVALQEPPIGLEALARERLSRLYPHQIFRGEGVQAIAILSSLPLRDVAFVEPPRGNAWLRARVEVDGRSVTAIAIHLSAWVAFVSRYAPAEENLEAMLADLAPGEARVLLGDFNTTPWSAPTRSLASAGLVDAFRAAGSGFGFTFPIFGRWRGVPAPSCVRIDYIWVTPSIAPLECVVGDDAGSDHRPLRARLAVTGSGG